MLGLDQSCIVLSSASGALTLTLDQEGLGGWCQVHLLAADASRPLGAERLKYIATQFTAFLADSAPGQRWVLSLSELHTTAYGEHVDGATTIALQDADATWFAHLVLTPDERRQWLRVLSHHTGP